MYRHLLVPIDGTVLSTDAVGRAVEFASGMDAQITFFHAEPGYDLFLYDEDAPANTISPQIHEEKTAGRAREILFKAEAAARAAGVTCHLLSKESDCPYEAIIATAQEQGCDLIFMASHARRGLKGLLGSQTQRVLLHSEIPVLVGITASSAPKLNKAIAIIQDEHRSLAVVIRGLQFLVNKAREQGARPNFELLSGMLRYIVEFPEALHHPKEELYLFRRLNERTEEMSEVITELQRQHVEGKQLVKNMEQGLADYMKDVPDAPAVFSQAVDRFAKAEWHHMSMEEKVILPAARKYLTDQDWMEIAEAFGTNGDPHFTAESNEEFRTLFSKIFSLGS